MLILFNTVETYLKAKENTFLLEEKTYVDYILGGLKETTSVIKLL